MTLEAMTSNGKHVRWMLFSAAVLVAFVAGTPRLATAAKPQPSPFAGDYRGALSGAIVTINVSGNGHVSGEWFSFDSPGGSVGGSITDEGIMTLRFRGRRGSGADFVAVVQQDEEGNLVGVGAWEGSEYSFPITFFVLI